MTAAALCGVPLMLAWGTSPAPSAPAGLAAAKPARPAAIAIATAPVTVPVAPKVAAVSISDIEAAVRDTRARGGDEGEVYRVRAAGLTARTIALLGEREQAEKAWMHRVEAWRAASAQLDEAGRKRLRDQLFSEAEQAQLASYETGDVPRLVLQ
jgi:hypothetical protein